MLSQFVTKTFPNHQSIATGLYEQYHGIVNNKFWDPNTNQSFDNFNLSPIEFWDEFNVSVPIYMANQFYFGNSFRRFSGSVQWPGSWITYGEGVNALSQHRFNVSELHNYDHSEWNDRMDQVVTWMTRPDQPVNCVFVYFNEPDGLAHRYGPFHPVTKAQANRLDKTLSYFLDKLSTSGLDPSDINLIVLSDHGFTEVTAERRIYLDTCQQNGLEYKVHGVSPSLSLWPVNAPESFLKQTGGNVTLAIRDALNECSQSKHNGKFKVRVEPDQSG